MGMLQTSLQLLTQVPLRYVAAERLGLSLEQCSFAHISGKRLSWSFRVKQQLKGFLEVVKFRAVSASHLL